MKPSHKRKSDENISNRFKRQALLSEFGTIRIKKVEVPQYLHTSAFWQSWDDCDDSVFIPSSVLKRDVKVTNRLELVHILKTLRFWITTDVPHSVFEFIVRETTTKCMPVLAEFERDLSYIPLLMCLLCADCEDRWWVALEHDNLICIRAMFEAGLHTQLESSCTIAAGVGRISTIAYLREQGCAWDAKTCANAAKNGQLECLKYLHQNGCPWSAETCELSSAGGHVPCLMYALHNGCPWSTATFLNAGENGHVHVLQALPPIPVAQLMDDVAYIAAENGQLGVLKYLHSAGCDWDPIAPMLAARYGHLECLQYLHEEVDCPWAENTCLVASKFNQIHCLKYAIERGCPFTRDIYHKAATRGHIGKI